MSQLQWKQWGGWFYYFVIMQGAGTPVVDGAILTEGDDFLDTEDGDHLGIE